MMDHIWVLWLGILIVLKSNKLNLIFLGIICGIAFLVMVLLLLALRKRIQIAIQLIKEGSRYVV